MAREAQDGLLAGLLSTALETPGVTARERALLAYADVLTLTPAAVTQELISALREAGCDDRAIHDACAIISYFAFVNRMADGLGVDLEGDAPGGARRPPEPE
ncbi:MAG: carboxymuconolactone decarboxylase family protein [Gemmatimonadales bacterium]